MPSTPDDLTFDALATGAVTGGVATASSRDARLEPGVIIAGRYRLVALLGRGGMGEVYRADDLTLNQPVALKFLPLDADASEARLAQFHNELRTARQVSHKNVCRLYDLGEADGRRFLTMEYVDGEDLASLLRRIGRIPHDKALQIARQLCAGVAAAHERGVLHRDLKPANVMIDGEGNVRITDFGIATAAAGAAEFVGTPQYMAPEQFAGRPASVRSDIFALGLILFEVFTGRRAVASQTLADLRQFHESGTLPTPSSIVHDLDESVERVILRCLDRDPERRPPSALTVAASLPGADPLAAALAAGETPSPEIVAACGEVTAFGVLPGLVALAAVIVGLIVFAAVSSRTSFVGRTPLGKPPAVLADRAAQIIASLGYPADVGDEAYGFELAGDYIQWLRNTRSDAHRWDALATGDPAGVLFWYRTSPRYMFPLVSSLVRRSDPTMTDTDMRLVVLDPAGRLQEFRSVPLQFDQRRGEAPAPPWEELFAAAGLDRTRFTPVEPAWTPRDFADVRAAWQGPSATLPDVSVRVEAAAYRGAPVAFSVIGPWTRPTRMTPIRQGTADRIAAAVLTVLAITLIGVGMLFARRNIRAKRADRRGALRLTAFVVAAATIAWAIAAHHTSAVQQEARLFFQYGGDIALAALQVWILYMAIEPYVRKFWPDSLLGWSRLLAGHVRDPRVGRDALIGMVFGVALALVDLAKATVPPLAGMIAPYPDYGTDVDILASSRRLIGTWVEWSFGSVRGVLLIMLIIVGFRLVVRRTVASVVLTVLLLSLLSVNQMGSAGPVIYLFPLISGILLTFVVYRFGLLAFALAMSIWNVVTSVPMTMDASHWSAVASNATIAMLVALTCFAFYASRAGQPLFGRLLDD